MMGEVLPFVAPALPPRDPRFVPVPTELCQLAGIWRGTLPPGQWDAEEKVDGVRAVWFEGQLWSREGVPLMLLHVTAELERLERRFGEPMVIDGEYQEPGGFLNTLSVVQSRGRREARGTMHVFDALPLRNWGRDECGEDLAQRRRWLTRAWEGFAPAHLRRVMAVPVTSAADVDRAAAAVWARGGEGLVLKRREGLYLRARSVDWLKVKREITLTGEIVELVEGKRAARIAIGARMVRIGLTAVQASTLAVGMHVQVEAMEWTERSQLRHARIMAMGGQ